MKQCPYCNTQVQDNAYTCPCCNNVLPKSTPGGCPPYGRYNGMSQSFINNDAFADCPEGKSRGITALLAIFLGGLGVHYFYLGKVAAGIYTILLTMVTCGLFSTLMFVQGIVILCMNNIDFRNKYVITTTSFPVF